MDPPFTVHRSDKRRGTIQPTHAHDAAQLTFAASGVLQVHTAEGRWLVPSQLAAWIPPGFMHHVEILADAELWVVHWQASAIAAWAPALLPARPFALRVTPLLRSLLTAAVAPDTGIDKAELVVRLILHDLTAIAHAPTFLPLPTTAAARRVADLALDDPRADLDLGQLAFKAATSVRTASRLFAAETGLSFKSWRQRARIVHAMDRLGRGDTIAQVAAGCGFASTAAFSHAFRQVVAATPTEFVAQGRVGRDEAAG